MIATYLLFITVIWNLYVSTTSQQYVFVDELVSATGANQKCQDLFGTHLASIHSAADNLEAQTLCVPQATEARQGCWIGLEDFDVEAYTNGNLFNWYDGSTLDYTNWRSGEPNEYYSQNGGEDLVMIRKEDGEWVDELNSRVFRLICWKPEQVPTDAPTKYPTTAPIKNPTSDPSQHPSLNPTDNPSTNPTDNPAGVPAINPTETPSEIPTAESKSGHVAIGSTTQGTESALSPAEGTVHNGLSIMDIVLVGSVIFVFCCVLGVALICMFRYICPLLCIWRKIKLYKPDVPEDVVMSVMNSEIASTSAVASSDNLFGYATNVDSDAVQSALSNVHGENDDDKPKAAANAKIEDENNNHDVVIGMTRSNDHMENPMMTDDHAMFNIQNDDGMYQQAVAKGDDVDQCTDCGETKSGKIYEADGLFYCFECWKQYENC